MNIIQQTLINENRTLKKPKRVRPAKESKAIQREYFKKLKLLVNTLKEEVRKELLPYLEQNQSKFRTTDGVSEDLTVIFERLRNRFFNIGQFAESTASTVVNGVDKNNKDKVFRSIKNAVGIDLNQVLAQEGLEDFVKMQTMKNATLIKSIPEEFFKQIETTVLNGTTEGKTFKQIAKEIAGVKDISSNFGKLENRIKLIARNETSTLTSQIAKKRYENLGIEKAIWRTAQDERVRPCHNARDGKEYILKDGLFSSCDGRTIQAGEEINCRCIAEPIIEF